MNTDTGAYGFGWIRGTLPRLTMSMTVDVQSPLASRAAVSAGPGFVALWLLAGLLLGMGIGRPPVVRTQEARVLETARQMRGTGWRGWLIPRINGTLRLKKPPLTYWMAAISYDVAGVGKASGRMPTVLCGWLTLGVTFAAARRAFGTRAALLAATCLLCSFIFYRHNRLAETDAPSALFATFAIYAWWKAVDPPAQTQNAGENSLASHPCRWFNLGAAATALAILFKGGPGGYPPVFLLGLILLRRRWNALPAFLKSGAPLILVLLAGPWFAYAQHATHSDQFSGEVDTLFSGQDHPGPFYVYGPELLKAAAPFSLIVLAALGAAIGPAVDAARRNDRLTMRLWMQSPAAVLLVWIAAILLPLCCIGNKQFHYLLPVMPPLMILVGALLDRATRAGAKALSPLTAALIDGTMLGTVVAAPLVLVAAHRALHYLRWEDWALAAALAIAGIAVAGLYVRQGRAAACRAYLIACVLTFPPAVGLWLPSLEMDDTPVAGELQSRYGAGPFVFYGPNYSLPLCFNLRARIPSMRTEASLREAARDQPRLVVIAQSKGKYKAPVPPPDEFTKDDTLFAPGQSFEIYRRRAAP